MEKNKNYTSDRGALATSGPEIVSVRLLDTCSLYVLHLIAGQGDDECVSVCVCVWLLRRAHASYTFLRIYIIQSAYCRRHDVTVSSTSSIIVYSVRVYKHPAAVSQCDRIMVDKQMHYKIYYNNARCDFVRRAV